MKTNLVHLLMVIPAFWLAACATDVRTVLSEDDSRRQAIETLIGDPAMRGEVVEHLLSAPSHRNALFEQIVENEPVAGAMIEHMMQSDRCQAQMATQISSNGEVTRAFMRKLMLTGAVGEILTQKQAEDLGLGEAFAHGNQQRTMLDLRRLGGVVDGWARANDRYPVCDRYDVASGCLASLLPRDALAGVRLKDAWGRPFLYQSDSAGKTYALLSYATDGLYDGLGKVGPTSSHDADIVYSDGDFVQWPGRIRRETIR